MLDRLKATRKSIDLHLTDAFIDANSLETSMKPNLSRLFIRQHLTDPIRKNWLGKKIKIWYTTDE